MLHKCCGSDIVVAVEYTPYTLLTDIGWISILLIVGNVLRNWTIVWLGNLVGGGLIMGGIYGWLNRTRTNYRD